MLNKNCNRLTIVQGNQDYASLIFRHTVYIASWRLKIQRRSEDRAKPNPIQSIIIYIYIDITYLLLTILIITFSHPYTMYIIKCTCDKIYFLLQIHKCIQRKAEAEYMRNRKIKVMHHILWWKFWLPKTRNLNKNQWKKQREDEGNRTARYMQETNPQLHVHRQSNKYFSNVWNWKIALNRERIY